MTKDDYNNLRAYLLGREIKPKNADDAISNARRYLGEIYQKNWKAVLDDARERQKMAATEEIPGPRPGQRIRKRELSTRLTPWTSMMRRRIEERDRELYGGKLALPFLDLEEAVGYMEGWGSRGPKPSQKIADRADAIIEEMDALHREITAIPTPSRMTWGFSGLSLILPRPDGEFSRMPIERHAPLAGLATECKGLAIAAGVSELNLAAHVLVDAPLLPLGIFLQTEIHQHQVSEEEDEWVSSRFVTVTIHAAELDPSVWRSIRQKVRRRMGAFRKKPLTEKHDILHEVVTEMGGPPKDDKVEWWEEVWMKCGERNVKWTSWRGPRLEWDRMQKRLNS